MSDTLSVAIEQRQVGMVTLRGDLAAPAIAEAVSAITGCAIPPARRVIFAGTNAVAWMSPDELLLLLAAGTGAATVEALGETLHGNHHLVVDVSDARAVFRIAGPGARSVLASGAPIDLTPASFGSGDLRRTRLGQLAAAFWMPEPDVFDLVCFRSVAGFVADWLDIAARPGMSAPGLWRERHPGQIGAPTA